MSQHLAEYLARLRSDFVFYANELWRDRELDKHSPLGEVEIDMLRYMAGGPYGTNDIGPERVALGPRGIGKTYLLNVYISWLWYKDPGHKVAVVSKARDHARESLRMLRQWLTLVPFLNHLAPELAETGDIKEQRDNAYFFDVAGSNPDDRVPSCTAKGISSMVTGGRAHTIIFDDIETPENTRTMLSRVRLNESTRELANLLYPGGEMVGLGTFHHEDSVYLELKRRGFVLRTWPILYPTPEERSRIEGLAPSIASALDSGKAKPGDITAPLRFDRTEIDRRRARGRRNWNMQHMLLADLGKADRYPLKLSDLIVFDAHHEKAPIAIAWGKSTSRGSTMVPDLACEGFEGDHLYGPMMVDNHWEKYQGVHLWVDPSGRGKDETAWAVVAHLNGMLYALCVRGDTRGTDGVVLASIADDAERFRVGRVFVEDNFGQGAVARLLEPVLQRRFTTKGEHKWSCLVESTRIAGRSHKEERIIDALEPVTSNHRLVVRPQAIEYKADLEPAYQLQHQLTRITREPGCLQHDDRLEALASCVATFTGEMGTDTEYAANHSRRLRHEREDRILDITNGFAKVNSPRWNSLL